MELYTCDKCKEEYTYNLTMCPGCLNTSFDVEEFSDCCGAKLIGEIGLCSDCKEHCN